jgi:hypothetical protein
MGQTAMSRDVALMSAFLLIANKNASRPICIDGSGADMAAIEYWFRVVVRDDQSRCTSSFSGTFAIPLPLP